MAKKDKKGFFAEFKAFITRGNVVDMAVGVIIAGAFTKIVTSLTNDILMPLINAVISLITNGKEVLLITVLNKEEYLINTGTVDEPLMTVNPKCIFINWSNFIEAIINFLLIALVLFLIIKIINGVHNKMEEKKAAREARLNPVDEEALKAEQEAQAKAEIEAAEEQARLDKIKAEEKTTNELLVELLHKLDK